MNDHESRLCHLVLHEFNAHRSPKQALHHVQLHCGRNSITREFVNTLYIRFHAGRTELPPITERLPSLRNNRATLFRVNDPLFNDLEIGPDGRVGICPNTAYRVTSTLVVDAFHGRIGEIPIDKCNHSIANMRCFSEFLDAGRVLFVDHSVGGRETKYILRLMEIDHKKWMCKTLDTRTFHHAFPSLLRIFPDLTNSNKFLVSVINMSDFSEICHTGEIRNNRIVLHDDTDLHSPHFIANTVIDGKVVGFVDLPANGALAELAEYNPRSGGAKRVLFRKYLTTSEGRSIVDDFTCFCWKKDRFYVAIHDAQKCTSTVYAVDLNKARVIGTNITLLGYIYHVAVDENDILTTCTMDNHQQYKERSSATTISKHTAYRFALRRPDSLRNLAWMSIRFAHTFMKSDLYEKLRTRLPYNTDLRCIVPDE